MQAVATTQSLPPSSWLSLAAVGSHMASASHTLTSPEIRTFMPLSDHKPVSPASLCFSQDSTSRPKVRQPAQPQFAMGPGVTFTLRYPQSSQWAKSKSLEKTCFNFASQQGSGGACL